MRTGAGLMCLLAAAPARAASPAPQEDWYGRISPDREAVYRWERGCRASYVLSWNGVLKAGEMEIEIESRDSGRQELRLVSAKAQGKSAGLARIFWHYDCKYNSLIDVDTFVPREILYLEEERKDRTRTEVEFEKGRAVCLKRVEQKKDGEVDESRRVFKAPRIHDLTSGILYLRSQPLETGDEMSLVIYPFDTSYLVTFRVLEREPHRTEAGKFAAIKLDLGIEKILKGNRLERYKKFKRATIWISDDAFRMPLEIRAEIFVGSIRAEMVERGFSGGE